MTIRTTIGLACALAAAVLLAPPPARAQDNSAAMRAMIAQLRRTATEMEGQLPQADIDEMRRNADELERANAKGAFVAPVVHEDANDIFVHMARAHNGTFEWLARTTACAGYQWEIYRVHTITSGDRDAERNALCKRAFASFERYFYTQRGGDRAAAAVHLRAYDATAHEVEDFFEGRTEIRSPGSSNR